MAVITPPLSGGLQSLYRSLYPTVNQAFLGGAAAWNPIPYAPADAPTFGNAGLNRPMGGVSPAAPAAGAVTPTPGGSVPGFDVGDYQNDPIVGRVRSAVEAQTSEAEARALAEKRSQLIRFGDPAMAQSLLGKDAGDAVNAARDNPFSTVHDLDVWNARSLTGIDETRNQQNLFYSTTRGRDRALQEESMLRSKAKASAQLQDVMNQISQDVINVRNSGLQQIIAAEEAAYNRAMERALAQAQMAAYASASAAPSYGGDSGYGGGSVVVDQPQPMAAPTIVPLAPNGQPYTPTRTSGLAEF